VFEPAVTVAIGTITQGCMASETTEVTYKVWGRVVAKPAVSGTHAHFTIFPLAHATLPAGCHRLSPCSHPQVPVTYTGSKKPDTPLVAPIACKVATGSLNEAGNGTVVYACTFAGAATANQTTLNFTAVGLIDGAYLVLGAVHAQQLPRLTG
jgi:hypothetical protein